MKARLWLLIAGAGAIALPAAAQLAVGPDAGGYLCPDGRQLYVKSCYDESPGANCGVVNMHLPLNRGQWQVETTETRTNLIPGVAACKVYPVEFRNDGTVGLVAPKSVAPAPNPPSSQQAAKTPTLPASKAPSTTITREDGAPIAVTDGMAIGQDGVRSSLVRILTPGSAVPILYVDEASRRPTAKTDIVAIWTLHVWPDGLPASASVSAVWAELNVNCKQRSWEMTTNILLDRQANVLSASTVDKRGTSAKNLDVTQEVASAIACGTALPSRVQRLASAAAAIADAFAGPAPKTAANPVAPATKAIATGTAGSVLDSISASDWLSQSSLALLDRVIAGSSKSALDSAAKTDARAQALVGTAHLVGAHGYAKNDSAAEKFLRAASSLRNPIAQNNLALMLQTGRVAGGKADVVAAAALYKLAAAQGYAVAQLNAGILYQDGLGVAEDAHEALRYFRLAAAQGNAQAQYALGQLLRYSYDQQFHQEAREAFAAASKTGHADSLLELAKIYESEIDSDEAKEYVDEMYADAVAAFKRDAAAGDAYAMRRLAEIYHDGEGVTRNYEEARKSFTAASERGDAWSTFQLGRMLARGEGGPKELMNAQLLYLRAASTGDMNVQSAYGELYLKGEDGVAKEQSLAIKLFKLAAAQGEPKAQAHLKALGVKSD